MKGGKKLICNVVIFLSFYVYRVNHTRSPVPSASSSFFAHFLFHRRVVRRIHVRSTTTFRQTTSRNISIFQRIEIRHYVVSPFTFQSTRCLGCSPYASSVSRVCSAAFPFFNFILFFWARHIWAESSTAFVCSHRCWNNSFSLVLGDFLLMQSCGGYL